jgi:hypothetical protein
MGDDDETFELSTFVVAKFNAFDAVQVGADVPGNIVLKIIGTKLCLAKLKKG